MYWCCGRKGKEALGCQTSKHVSKEDEDEEVAKEKEDDKFKQGNLKCSSCKEVGHKAHECTKDPNIRSAIDAIDEIERIDGIKSRKKANVNNIDVNQKLMGILNARFGQAGFGDDLASSVGNDSLRDKVEEEMENAQIYDHNPFKDIKSIKSEISFHKTNNAVRIEDISTKEEHENVRNQKRRQTASFKESKNMTTLSQKSLINTNQEAKSPKGEFKLPSINESPSKGEIAD